MFIPIAVFYDNACNLQAVRVFRFSLNAPDLARVALAHYGNSRAYCVTNQDIANMESSGGIIPSNEDRAFYADVSIIDKRYCSSPVLASSATGVGYPQLEDFNNCVYVNSKTVPLYQAFQFEGVDDIPVSEFHNYPELSQMEKAGLLTGMGSIATYIEGELVHDCLQIISYKDMWLLNMHDNEIDASLYRSFFKMRNNINSLKRTVPKSDNNQSNNNSSVTRLPNSVTNSSNNAARKKPSEKSVNKRISGITFYAPVDSLQCPDFAPYAGYNTNYKASKSACAAYYSFLMPDKGSHPVIAVTGTGAYRPTDFSRLQQAYMQKGASAIKLGNISPEGYYLTSAYHLLYGMLTRVTLEHLFLLTGQETYVVNDEILTNYSSILLSPDTMRQVYERLTEYKRFDSGLRTFVIPAGYRSFESADATTSTFEGTEVLVAPTKMTKFEFNGGFVPNISCPREVTQFELTLKSNSRNVKLPSRIGTLSKFAQYSYICKSNITLDGYLGEIFDLRAYDDPSKIKLVAEDCYNLARINTCYVDPSLSYNSWESGTYIEVRGCEKLQELNLFQTMKARRLDVQDSRAVLSITIAGDYTARPLRINIEGSVKHVMLTLEGVLGTIEVNSRTSVLIVKGSRNATVRSLVPCYNVITNGAPVEICNKTGRVYKTVTAFQ